MQIFISLKWFPQDFVVTKMFSNDRLPLEKKFISLHQPNCCVFHAHCVLNCHVNSFTSMMQLEYAHQQPSPANMTSNLLHQIYISCPFLSLRLIARKQLIFFTAFALLKLALSSFMYNNMGYVQFDPTLFLLFRSCRPSMTCTQQENVNELD